MEIEEQIPLGFTSLSALKDAHKELLKRYRESEETPSLELLDEIESFSRKVQATGAVLERESEQDAAQDLLDFWVTRLYRAGRKISSTSLADFDPTLSPMLDETMCPFVGLDAFSEDKSKYFFGRKAMVRKLLDWLKQNNLLVVDGPSGSGKSSLVLAGLLPALKSGALEGNWHFYPRMVPGSEPLVNLARTVKPPEENASDWIARQVAKLHEDPNHLANLSSQVGRPVILVIDQFEEVFTLTTDLEARAAFEKNLLGLVQVRSPRNLLILTMRSDFNSSIPLLPTLQPFFDDAVEAPTALTRAELLEAIVEPADQAGLKFEEGIVDKLADDLVGERAALPLLQFTLLKLWEKRNHNLITRAAYRELGGGREALARSADQFYQRLTLEDQNRVKRILLRLVRPGTGAIEFVANRIRRQELYQLAGPALIDPVLGDLIKEKLVRLTEGAKEEDAEVEIAHEALVRNWGTLVRWLEEERGRMTLARLLEGKADEWERRGRGRSGLLDKFDLREAENWIANPDAGYLGNIDKIKPFVSASKTAIDRDKEEKARAERNLRRSRAAAAVLAIIALFTAGLAVKLLVQATRDKEEISRGAVAKEELNKKERQWEIERQQKKQEQNDRITRLRETQIAVLKGEEKKLSAALLAEKAARSRAEDLQGQLKKALAGTKNANDNLANANATLEQDKEAGVAEDVADDSTAGINLDPDLSAPLAVLAVRAITDKDIAKRVAQDATVGTESAVPKTVNALRLVVEALQTRIVLGGGAAPVEDIAFSPDGLLLATAGKDGLKLWDAVRGGQQIRSVSSKAVMGVAFSPDGQLLVGASSEDGTFSVWSTATWDLDFVGSTRGGPVTAMAFSPDGRRLVAAGRHGLQMWDVPKKTEISLSRVTPEEVKSVTFSPDGAKLLTAGGDDTVKLWDSADGKLLNVFRRTSGPKILAVAFAPDGRRFATANQDGTATLWEAQSGQPLRTFSRRDAAATSPAPVTTPVTSVAFSPDRGKRLATANEDNSATVWDTNSGSRLLDLKGHKGRISRIVFSPDGSRLATGSQDKTARVWDSESKELLSSEGHDDLIVSLATSQDGSKFVTGSIDKTAKVWETASGRLLLTLKHPEGVWGVDLSRDGRYVATGCHDGVVRLWDAKDGELVSELKGHTDRVYGVAFSPDGTELAAGSGDKTVIVWDLPSKRILWKADFNESSGVPGVAFSPDGKLLAVATGENSAKMLDALSGQLVRPLEEQTGRVFGVAFSPDGRWLATANSDNTAKVWDLSSWTLHETLAGHTSPVMNVNFSPDSRQLVTASFDNSARIWDVDSGRALATLANNNNRVYGAAFTADAGRLITGSWDRTIRVYALDMNELTSLALARISHAGSAQTCRKHLNQGVCSNLDKALKQIVEGNQFARIGDLDSAVARYEAARQLLPELDLKPNEQAERVKEMGDEEARRLTFAGLYAKAQNLVRFNQDAAAKSLQQAAQSDPSSNLDPTAELAKLIAADKEGTQASARQELDTNKMEQERQRNELADEGKLYLQEGKLRLVLNDIKEGLEAYKKALNRVPKLSISAADWNALCWKGSLGGFENDPLVVQACDKAVQLSPDSGNYRDSRAVNEALHGKFADAAEDFQAFVKWTNNPKSRAQREGFIRELKNNKNPITSDVKKALLYEDTVPPSS
jgi:WD40 repeat protein